VEAQEPTSEGEGIVLDPNTHEAGPGEVKRQFNGAEGSSPPPCEDCKNDGGKVKRAVESHPHPNSRDGIKASKTKTTKTKTKVIEARATTVAQGQTPASTSTSVPAMFNNVPVTGGKKVLDELNGFRQRKGLKEFNWSAALTQNAFNTGAYDNSINNEWHDLKAPAMAEVVSIGITDTTLCNRDISPFTPFGLVLMSWLCEVPTDKAIGADCTAATSIGHYAYAETGHYDILSSSAYSNIGCWYTKNEATAPCSSPWSGFWVCDLN